MHDQSSFDGPDQDNLDNQIQTSSQTDWQHDQQHQLNPEEESKSISKNSNQSALLQMSDDTTIDKLHHQKVVAQY